MKPSAIQRPSQPLQRKLGVALVLFAYLATTWMALWGNITVAEELDHELERHAPAYHDLWVAELHDHTDDNSVTGLSTETATETPPHQHDDEEDCHWMHHLSLTIVPTQTTLIKPTKPISHYYPPVATDYQTEQPPLYRPPITRTSHYQA